MPETSEVLDSVPGFSMSSVARWLNDAGEDVTGGLTFERVGLGQSNLTYLVRDEAERKWILRRPPLGEILASAHDVMREARILAALTSSEVPVPQVLGVRGDDTVDDSDPAVLLEWVDGYVIDRPEVVTSMSEHARLTASLSLAASHAAIHQVDLDAAGLGHLASHAPYAARQLRRWSAQWDGSRTRDLPALDALTERLRRGVPEQHETTLVHGDLHLRNVMLGSNAEVVAVLDWELSTLGDPLADLGTLFAYWPRDDEPGIDSFAPTTLAGFPPRDVLADQYAARSGRDLEALGFWHALGVWKLAIIGEGVLRRALDEPLNRAADGTPTAQRIEALVDHGHEIASAAGI